VRLPAGIVTTGFLGPDRVVASWIDFNGRDRNGETVLFDARSLERIRTMSRGFEGVALDGRHTVAVPSFEGEISLLDVRTGRARMLQGRHEGDITDLMFSPDGRTLVSSGGDDGRIMLWDVATGQERETLRGHSGRAFGPVFTPDGTQLFSVGLDSSIIAWDVTGARRLGRAFEPGGPPPEQATEPSLDPVAGRGGGTYYVPTNDGRITFWRASDLTPARPPVDLGAPIDLAAAPDRRTLAALNRDGELVLLDESGAIRSRRRVGPRQPVPAQIAFHPGGRLLAVAQERGVALLDARSGAPSGAPLAVEGVTGVAFSPDGGRLSLSTSDGHVELWNVERRRRVYQRQPLGFNVYAVDYSPDGTLIAAGDDDGYLRFLDARTGDQVGAALRAHDGPVVRTGFSPDGRTVFSSGTDSAVSLWDVGSHQQIGSPLPVGQGSVFATFTDDGASLLATSDRGRAVVWSVDPAAWNARACAVAGRTLTPAEWTTFLPERPYSPACD
jgi:WD40 repeat protein